MIIKTRNRYEWRRIFAIIPCRLDDESWVWLEYVWERVGGGDEWGVDYEYSLTKPIE